MIPETDCFENPLSFRFIARCIYNKPNLKSISTINLKNKVRILLINNWKDFI